MNTDEQDMTFWAKAGATAIGLTILAGIGAQVGYSFWQASQERKAFLALEEVDPSNPSNLSLGDVFCTSAERDDRYNVILSPSVQGSIAVVTGDGEMVRINCNNYELPEQNSYTPEF